MNDVYADFVAIAEPDQHDGAPPEGDARPPAFTDEALALRFTKRHRDRLRYVAAWNRWMILDDRCWRPDGTLHAFDLARAVCREASSDCNDAKGRQSLASASTVSAVERLAKADRLHAATVDQWDADLWVINTPVGVLDLRTGNTRDRRGDDYVTKVTAVSPGGDCPRWLAFLRRVTAGDEALQRFLQRFAGYSLTGITREHALVFAYGTGGNGKSVFIGTLAAVMGDYAVAAPMEAFTASIGERHPTDLASMRGARLVAAQETEEGRRWDESRIKALTGGDKISARFMRQDFFEYTPQFKLIIAGNHKPGIRNVDEAIRRRLNLAPFVVKIPPDERNPNLLADLQDEWSGIMQWMLDGCLEWQRIGLAAPASVRAATDEYLDAEDALGQWLAECCVAGGQQLANGRREPINHFSTVQVLYDSWRTWAERAGEFVPSQKRFSQALRARGFVPHREGGTGKMGFTGLRARPYQDV